MPHVVLSVYRTIHSEYNLRHDNDWWVELERSDAEPNPIKLPNPQDASQTARHQTD